MEEKLGKLVMADNVEGFQKSLAIEITSENLKKTLLKMALENSRKDIIRSMVMEPMQVVPDVTHFCAAVEGGRNVLEIILNCKNIKPTPFIIKEMIIVACSNDSVGCLQLMIDLQLLNLQHPWLVVNEEDEKENEKENEKEKGEEKEIFASILHFCARIEALNVLGFLIKMMKGLKSVDYPNLLHVASWSGNVSVVKTIFHLFPELFYQRDIFGLLSLHHAIQRNHVSVVDFFLKCNTNNSSKELMELKEGDGGFSLLHVAVSCGAINCVHYLLENGADVNVCDSSAATALHHAVYHGFLDICKLLLWYGADIDKLDDFGESILHKCVGAGKDRDLLLRFLLSLGCEADVANLKGDTPLLFAVYWGLVKCTRVLLSLGKVKPNPETLVVAAASGILIIMKMILKMGELLGWDLSVDSMSAYGDKDTPLLIAIKNGHVNMVNLLISCGADIYKKDMHGMSTVDYAASKTAVGGGGVDPEKLVSLFQSRKFERKKGEFSSAEEEKRRRDVYEGIQKFNCKAKLGLSFLQNQKLVGNTPEDIAVFLYNTAGLSGHQKGEYLGGSDPLNLEVLHCFIKLMDFSNLEFDIALRKFLQCFRLPGEAQKIDRMMEAFAQQYFSSSSLHNFSDPDSAYVLAFSIIMLNTDAHNPQVKAKMSKEQFMRNSSSVVDSGGGALSNDFLSNIYDRIVNEEIKMEASMFLHAEKKGWMIKEGGRIKTWKKRWFVLQHNCLYYFKLPADKEPCGMIPLENVVTKYVPNYKKKYCFQLKKKSKPTKALINADSDNNANKANNATSANNNNNNITQDVMKSCKFNSKGTLVEGHHKSYYIAAPEEEEMYSWIQAINANSLDVEAIFDLLRKKKTRISNINTKSESLSGTKKARNPNIERTQTTANMMQFRKASLANLGGRRGGIQKPTNKPKQ